MERGLLSDKELGSNYDDVIWMYLFQDFSDSKADRRAQRVAIRFGISSWPQHFLIDPQDLRVVGDTGRNLESFRSAVEKGKLKKKQVTPSIKAFLAADKLAGKICETKSVALAQKHLTHSDVVVRYRSVEVLARKKPEALSKKAAELLETPNDQIRYKLCEVLAEHGDSRAASALEALVKNPKNSKNPNVLRSRTVGALARCGTVESLKAIEPHATTGKYFNMLTHSAIAAVQSIAERHPKKGKKPACAILRSAFPPAPKPESSKREKTACIGLARKVHKALGDLTDRKVPFPKVYSEETRAALISSWAK